MSKILGMPARPTRIIGSRTAVMTIIVEVPETLPDESIGPLMHKAVSISTEVGAAVRHITVQMKAQPAQEVFDALFARDAAPTPVGH